MKNSISSYHLFFRPLKIIYYLIFIELLFNGCDPLGDRRLKLYNNSDDTVFFKYSMKSSFENFKFEVRRNNYDEWNKVFQDTVKILPMHGDWESFIEDAENKTIKISIFNDDTLYRYPFDTIVKRKLYVQYEFTLEELQKLNWKITYPKPNNDNKINSP